MERGKAGRWIKTLAYAVGIACLRVYLVMSSVTDLD